CLDEKHRDCGGGIAEFYDTVEEEDFERFAEIARTKETCNKKFFVVNRGQIYHIVDTNDPSIRCICSPVMKMDYVWRMIDWSITIQEIIKVENKYLEYREKAKCVAGFELRDSQGVPLPEGTEFKLVIYNGKYHDVKGTEDGSEDNEYQEENVSLEYLSYDSEPDGHVYIYGSIDDGPKFGFKVVDGITYLTIDNLYLGVGEDDYARYVVATAEIPPKNRRIQIQYDENGFIFLSGWDGSSVISCEWVKCAYGAVDVSTGESDLRWSYPMELVIKV
ncbi:hypothetical protein LPJ75_002884, partial [Coemansia sp. RSA 2598]